MLCSLIFNWEMSEEYILLATLCSDLNIQKPYSDKALKKG